MAASNFTTAITVGNTAKEVFNCINDVRAWWQGTIEGESEQLNDEFSYRMLDMHYSKQKVVEIIPNKKIVWLVTDSNLSFTKSKNEWTGTRIIFEITEVNDKTRITFTHEGLTPLFECFGDCSNGWSLLIKESLYNLITTGKGVDVF